MNNVLVSAVVAVGIGLSAVAAPTVSNKVLRAGARIAFLGDSITQNGWNNADGYVRLVDRALQVLGTGCTVIPAGRSGNKSPDMLKRLDRDVLSKKPDIVIFSCGVNDVWHGMSDPAKGVSCADYAKTCGEILDRIAAAGATPVVLTPTMIGESPTTPENVKLDAYVKAEREVAAARGVPVIDLNAAMRTALKVTPVNRGGKRLTFDGVHMNDAGDRMMARTILGAFGLTGRKDEEIAKAWDDLHLNSASVAHIAVDGRTLEFDHMTGFPKGTELPKLPFDPRTARPGGVTRLDGRTLMSRVSSGDWTCDISVFIGRVGETVWRYDFTFRGEERPDLAVKVEVPPVSSPTLEAIRKAGIKLTRIDSSLWGFRRFTVDLDGWEGWIVEPKAGTAKPGNPWVWCMKWPGAFADKTGQISALTRGYHYVYLDNKLWMSEEGTRRAKAWRDLLVDRIGLAAKVNLIGMSWGGFFSTRYAATYPQDVAKVYLDNPVMSFHAFSPWKWGGVSEAWNGRSDDGRDWKSDPRMPINLAGPIAAAKIPVLLLYGDKDTTCIPEENCLIFLERFKAAGGDVTIFCREGCNHHPHGYEETNGGDRIVDFFERGR